MREENLSAAWSDCLGMVGVSEQSKHFLPESMKAWRLDLPCNNLSLGRVDIKQGYFRVIHSHRC